jgi:cytochrome c-type biogenesis protein CcmF
VAQRGDVALLKDGVVLRQLHPEKRNYFSSQMPMTETAIDSGFTRDLYVSLGEALDPQGSAWSVRVYYKPFVTWIWGGCLLMALGGGIAAADRRYRLKQRSAAVVQGAPA